MTSLVGEMLVMAVPIRLAPCIDLTTHMANSKPSVVSSWLNDGASIVRLAPGNVAFIPVGFTWGYLNPTDSFGCVLSLAYMSKEIISTLSPDMEEKICDLMARAAQECGDQPSLSQDADTLVEAMS